MSDAPEVRIVVDFLARCLDDRAKGLDRPLAAYLAEFPGHEEVVAEQFLLVRRGEIGGAPKDAAGGGAPDSGEARLGPYRLVRELGRGGQGIVWLAEDLRLGRRVALKVLQGGPGAEDRALRFRREAEVTSRLDHPGICVVYEVGHEDSTPYIAMRYVEGQSLSSLLRGRTGPVSERDELNTVLDLIEKASRALHAAHEAGIVHRDVKPANIMVTPRAAPRPSRTPREAAAPAAGSAPDDRPSTRAADGPDALRIESWGEPVLLDFGLARIETPSGAGLTFTGAVLGTPAYMAPEQLQPRALPIDRRADVYALGVTLFQALAGRLPFDAPTFEQLRDQVLSGSPPTLRGSGTRSGRDLEIVVATAMERDLARRYQSALDFADELARVRGGEPIRARKAGPWTKLRGWARRRPALAASLALLFLSLAAGLVASMIAFRAKSEQLEFYEQVADIRAVDRLAREEEDLHPAGPDLVGPLRRWQEEAAWVIRRKELHASALAEVRQHLRMAPAEETLASAVAAGRMLESLLSDLLVRLDRLAERVPLVRDREARSASLVERSLALHAARWSACIAAVRASPKYGGLELKPQPGLVPLHEDPRSGLWEFWHVESGEEPPWDAEQRRWKLAGTTGLVLVLIPAGTFIMGFDEGLNPVVDRSFERDKSARPRHAVTLGPYFLSKYEMTQGQWMRGDEGRNPAYYYPGKVPSSARGAGETFDLTHPVEFVSWTECVRLLRRFDLVLPTECQWESACRGGGENELWSSGSELDESLNGVANIAGLECEAALWKSWTPSFRDGFRYHSIAGTFAANPFGLHDVHGNVWEWCRDRVVESYGDKSPEGPEGLRDAAESEKRHILRGGSFYGPAVFAMSSKREWNDAGARLFDAGVRPSRPVR